MPTVEDVLAALNVAWARKTADDQRETYGYLCRITDLTADLAALHAENEALKLRLIELGDEEWLRSR